MVKRTREDQGAVYSCSLHLRQRWDEVVQRCGEAVSAEPLEPPGEGHVLIPLIRDCLRSATLSCHYVLPTQLLAKSVHPHLDAHAIQAGYPGLGAFDARTIAHDVIVPYRISLDRTNQFVQQYLAAKSGGERMA